MVGDYYRYMAESAKDDVLAKARDGALEYYKQADTVSKGLPACNPIKLGLALNFSVFHYEVLSDNKQACILAEGAL